MVEVRPVLANDDGVRAVYAAHGSELYRFALRSLGDRGLAEEAVQETFVRAWQAADRFDDELDRVLVAWQVEEALHKLSDEHRRALVEVHYRARPYHEVARDMGVPVGT